MKVVIKPECPGCKDKISVLTKSPGFLSPVVVSVKCSSCESDVLFRFSRAIGQRGQVDTRSKVVVASPRLIESMEFEKLSVEEQGKAAS